MLRKAEQMEVLPDTKEQQNRNISPVFFSYFPEDTTKAMKNILEKGTYVPQEILNITDF